MTDSDSTYLAPFIIICAGSFMAPVLMHSSTLAIPHMSLELNMGAQMIAWIPLAMAMGNAIGQFPAGRLGDIYGRGLLFGVGLVICAVTNLISGLAPNGETVILARFVQGLGSAAIFTTSLVLIADIVPDEDRPRILGIYVSVAYLGITCGPLFGGVAIEQFGWRSVFLLPAPIFLLIAIASFSRIRIPIRQEHVKPFDLSGTVLYSLVIFFLVSTLLRINRPEALPGLVIGLTLAVLFVRQQRRKEHPLVDLGLLFDNKRFGLACLVMLFFQASLFAIPFALTLYLQYIESLTAQTAGFVLMVQAIATVIAAPLGSKLMTRYSARPVAIAGMSFGAIAMALFIAGSSGYQVITLFIVALAVSGFAAGFLETPMTHSMMGAVESHQLGSASASINSTRMYGSFIGIGLISVFISSRLGDAVITPDAASSLAAAIQNYFVAGFGLITAAAFFLYKVLQPRKTYKVESRTDTDAEN